MNLSNSQLNKLKSATESAADLTLRLLSSMIGSNDRETSRLCKPLVNNLLLNIILSKSQMSNIKQSGRFLGRPLGPLMKFGLSLMKNVLTLLSKSVLILLELIHLASAIAAEIRKKILGYETSGSGTITLIISKE